MISTTLEHGKIHEALDCFVKLNSETDLQPDSITFYSCLKACGNLRDCQEGRKLHCDSIEKGISSDIYVGSTLISMYGKCGNIAETESVFRDLSSRNVVSWNALMAGYTQVGGAEVAVGLFNQMMAEGIYPNAITCLALLNLCNHAGLVDEGQMIFNDMERSYYLTPTIEHYTCMVDLFARTGHLDKTVAAIKEMPMNACVEAWSTLLSACRKWGNMDLGRVAFEHATVLDEKHVAAYVCMWNIYAVASIQENAEEELNGGHMEIRNVIQAEDKWPF